jgi:hypothetical protein
MAATIIPGTILACSGRGWVSRVIRGWTCSRYSHVAIVCNIFAGDLVERDCRRWKPTRTLLSRWHQFTCHSFVVESTTANSRPCEITGERIKGVQVHTLSDWLGDYCGDVYAVRPIVPLTYDESHRLSERLLDAVGTEYDTPGAGIAGLRWLDRWLPCSKDRRRYYCAELAADALLAARPNLPAICPGEVSPVDLVNCLVGSGSYAEPVLVSR